MAYSSALADTRVISQSDSNLLTSRPGEGNLRRNCSVDDMESSAKSGKGFLYRLVRPWKWRKKKKSKSESAAQNRGEFGMSALAMYFVKQCLYLAHQICKGLPKYGFMGDLID